MFWIAIVAALAVVLAVSIIAVMALPKIVLLIVGGIVLVCIPMILAILWLMNGFADYMAS